MQPSHSIAFIKLSIRNRARTCAVVKKNTHKLSKRHKVTHVFYMLSKWSLLSRCTGFMFLSRWLFCFPNQWQLSIILSYQTAALASRDTSQIYLAWVWLSYFRLKFHLALSLVAQKPQNLGNCTTAVVGSIFLWISSSMQEAVGVRFPEEHTAPLCMQGIIFFSEQISLISG